MSKRFSISVLIITGLFVLSGLVAFIYRVPLLETLISQQLRAQGIAVQSLRVADVSLKTITLRKLSLGSAGEIGAEEIIANWQLSKLLGGDLDAIDLSGMHLILDLSSDGILLGSLQHLIAQGDKNSTARRLPHFSLQDSRITLRTDVGDVLVSLHGDIEQDQNDSLKSRLAFGISGPPGNARGELDATMLNGSTLQGKIKLTEGIVSLHEAQIGGLTGDADFDIRNNQIHELGTKLQFTNITLLAPPFNGMPFEQASFSLQMDNRKAQLNSTLRSASDSLVTDLEATVQNYLLDTEFKLDINARGTENNKIWTLLKLPAPDDGSFALNMKASGQTPPLRDIRDNFLPWLQDSKIAAAGQLGFQDISYQQKISDLQGLLEFHGEVDNGEGQVTLTEKSIATATTINSSWLKTLGVPAEFAQQLTDGTSLRINAIDNQSSKIDFRHNSDGTGINIAGAAALSSKTAQINIRTKADLVLDRQYLLSAFNISGLRAQASGIRFAENVIDHLSLGGEIHGLPQKWAGDLTVDTAIKQLIVAPLAAQQANATLPLHVKFNEGSWNFNVRQPGKVSVEKVALPGAITIPGQLTASIPHGDIELTSQSEGAELSHDIAITPTNFSIHMDRDEQPPIDAHIRAANIVLTGKLESSDNYRGQGNISIASIVLPQSQLLLDSITARLNLDLNVDNQTDGDAGIANFNIGTISHTAATPLFTPHTVSGNVFKRTEVISINANAGLPITQYAQLTGKHALDSGNGELIISIPSLRFSPGILQPAALIPELAILKDVSATANANAEFNWSKDGITTSNGLFKLQDSSFNFQDITISGLNAALALDDLLSSTTLPHSPAGQRVMVRSIDLGVPLENLGLTYQIRATDPPSIAIDDAMFTMIGGKMSLAPTIVDLGSTHAETILYVKDLDLGSLFELIQAEGLSGTGRLEGSIPITLKGTRVAIHKGRVAASAPGILRFKSEKVSQLLSGAGKEMNLLLEALTEFHYTELVLKLEKPINDDLVATLSLLGNNPNVRNGQMFRFNINLESNIGEILDTITQGYIISNEALRNIFRLR